MSVRPSLFSMMSKPIVQNNEESKAKPIADSYVGKQMTVLQLLRVNLV